MPMNTEKSIFRSAEKEFNFSTVFTVHVVNQQCLEGRRKVHKL